MVFNALIKSCIGMPYIFVDTRCQRVKSFVRTNRKEKRQIGMRRGHWKFLRLYRAAVFLKCFGSVKHLLGSSLELSFFLLHCYMTLTLMGATDLTKDREQWMSFIRIHHRQMAGFRN